jgi:hypothetical protein
LKPAAALGFRVHSGWAALVAISLDGCSPLVLQRQRPHLVKTFTYEFRQPYHTAQKKAIDEARAFVSNAQAEARHLAARAVESARGDLQKQGYKLARCGLLLASGRQLPELAQILRSHTLIHTADGELFRNALLDASKSCGLTIFTTKENELLESASRTLQQPYQELMARLADASSYLGAPWSQDEKFSALVAWLALVN